ncbi:YqhR family membrane protein [Neobacillus dielmonensis]|uniref:YqhR family membrane protein n=1 Tax=Neobacillus dielmonensis TaxID=1347369 RepID=UPI0005A8100D|nr:YqhR family membrane protein [Neobacillus dielmonensis]
MTDLSKSHSYKKPMTFSAMVFWTGLFGGVFWSTIGYLCYFFHLTEVRPHIILETWFSGDWRYGWGGSLLSILLLGILSAGVSFIYYGLLKKFNGKWVGMAYGLVLFFIVFFVLNPLFPGIKPIVDLSRNTLMTSICLFVLYGLFIGYSIHYEYENKKLLVKEELGSEIN